MIEAPQRQKSDVHSGAMEPLAARQTAYEPGNVEIPAFLRRAPETPSVAISGRAGVGKTSLAVALGAHGYLRHTWAGPIYELAALAYGPVAKDQTYFVGRHGEALPVSGRHILQRIGTEALRDQVDEDFWIKVGLRRLEPGRKYANDDTRFPNEADALRAHGFVVVKLVAGPEVRASRLGVSAAVLAEADAHPSEAGQDRIEPDVRFDTSRQPIEAIAGDLVAWLKRRSVA